MKLSLISSFTLLLLPSVLLAQGNVYAPLVDLSNAGQGNQVQTFEEYVNFLYGMSIAVAALLAVIKIVIAGAKYMFDDLISGKEDAKKDIQGAILGLLLILSAVIILELINPQLTDKSISFPGFQSPRGDLQSLAVNTTSGGQTTAEFTESLRAGVDSCMTTVPSTSATGGSTIVTANTSACTGAGKSLEQLQIFERNCIEGGGNISWGAKLSGIGICTTLNQAGISQAQLTAARGELSHIKNSFGFNADIDGDGTRITYKLTDEYIKLEGTTIMVESKRFCENTFTLASMSKLEPLQRREVLDGCLTHNWGATRCSFINNGYNRDAIITAAGFNCPMPKQIIQGSLLKVPDSLGTRPPKNYQELQDACGEDNDLIKSGGIVYKWQDGWLGGIDITDYECHRY